VATAGAVGRTGFKRKDAKDRQERAGAQTGGHAEKGAAPVPPAHALGDPWRLCVFAFFVHVRAAGGNFATFIARETETARYQQIAL
jgi:hypothetical protein